MCIDNSDIVGEGLRSEAEASGLFLSLAEILQFLSDSCPKNEQRKMGGIVNIIRSAALKAWKIGERNLLLKL